MEREESKEAEKGVIPRTAPGIVKRATRQLAPTDLELGDSEGKAGSVASQKSFSLSRSRTIRSGRSPPTRTKARGSQSKSRVTDRQIKLTDIEERVNHPDDDVLRRKIQKETDFHKKYPSTKSTNRENRAQNDQSRKTEEIMKVV